MAWSWRFCPTPGRLTRTEILSSFKDHCWANARDLEQSWRDDGSAGEDNLLIAKHLPAGRLGRSRILPLLA